MNKSTNHEHFMRLYIFFLHTSTLSACCTPFLYPQLNNAHSLQTDWPHLHHFGTKWNGLCFDEPARPPVAAELQAAHHWKNVRREVLRKSALIIALAPLALRCVLSQPFHISHTPSNSFPRKNELPSSHSEHRDYGKLQAVTGGECGLLSQGRACHRHACLFSD